MKFTVVKLKPKSPFHIGEREGWREGSKAFISSDTVFSALCHCYRLLYGEVDSLLKGFLENNPPFLISSAFPYWQDNYFFPVSKNQIPKEKTAKKTQFIELNGLQRMLAGEGPESILREIKTIPDERCPFYPLKTNDKDGKPYPWHIEDVPRVGLSRLTNHPDERFFHFGQVTYFEDAGLFLLVDFRNDKIKNRFLACLNLLVHEGIGGDRTCGRGMFEKPEFSEIELNTISNPDGFYSLSLYYPSKDEIIGIEKGFYELEDRKGYIYSPSGQSLRRRSIRMFTEGSVFQNNNKRFGSLVDVTPEVFKAHRVYRYGFIFSLPCKLGAT